MTTIYRVETDNDSVTLDHQHRDHKWINKMDEHLHPYLKEMIKTADSFKE